MILLSKSHDSVISITCVFYFSLSFAVILYTWMIIIILFFFFSCASEKLRQSRNPHKKQEDKNLIRKK